MFSIRGMWYHSWLRHYATSQKVMGSIPVEVTGFFIWPRNLPGSKRWPARKAENVTPICLQNVGAAMPHNPMGLHGLLDG
jgi:hypothetical protein